MTDSPPPAESLAVQLLTAPASPLLGMEDEASMKESTRRHSVARSAMKARTARNALIAFSLALLVGWVANNVLWIYMSLYFGPIYAYFSAQFTTSLQVVFMIPLVLWRIRNGTITKETRSTMHWTVYATMGLLDSLYIVLTTMASPFTSAPVQNLIFQLPVPITMILTKLLWHTKFAVGQYVGATIIIGGAMLSVMPSWLHPVSAADAGLQDNRASALTVYIIGVAAYAVSSTYKSWALKRAPLIDVWYVSTIENAWAVFFGFVLLPLLWVPGVGSDTPSNTFPHFAEGAKCFAGHDSEPDISEATCTGLWWITIIYVASNILVAILGLEVCRRGDSVIFNVVSSAQLPISNIVFSSSFIMTAALASDFSPWLWVAVCTVTVGFAIYQFLPLQRVVKEVSTTDDPLLLDTTTSTPTNAAGGGSAVVTVHLQHSPRSVADLADEEQGNGLLTGDSHQLEEVLAQTPTPTAPEADEAEPQPLAEVLAVDEATDETHQQV